MKTNDGKTIRKGNTYWWVHIYPHMGSDLQFCPLPSITKVKCLKTYKEGDYEYTDFSECLYAWKNINQKMGDLIFSDKYKALRAYRKATNDYIEYLEQESDRIIAKLDFAKENLKKVI